jgi:hypothetical protein
MVWCDVHLLTLPAETLTQNVLSGMRSLARSLPYTQVAIRLHCQLVS